MNKKYLALIVFSLYPIALYAHAGWIDRMMQDEVNCIAVLTITFVVQIILSYLSFWKLKETVLFRKARVICWRVSKRWDSPLLFSVCVPFILLPFIRLVNAWLYIIAIIPDIIIGVTYLVWISKIHFTRPKMIWKKLYVVVILAIQQVVGIGIYCITYDTPIVKHVINNPDGWDRKDMWIYPEFDIIPEIIVEYLSVLIVLIGWHLVLYFIQLIIKLFKHSR